MAPIPIETTQEVSSFAIAIIPSAFISLFLLTFILLKCLKKSRDNTAFLIAASRTSLNNVTNPISEEKGVATPPIVDTVIIDERTLKEMDESSKSVDHKNVSMMNLLFSNTPSSTILNERETHSVSTENILMPSDSLAVPGSSPSISKDTSSQSLHNSTVVENLNVTEEIIISEDSSLQADLKDPQYDEVRVSNPYAPKNEARSSSTQPKEPEMQEKKRLKQTLSDEGLITKPHSITNPANIIIDPPRLPARNLRLGSMPSNTTRPIINKPKINTADEVYESIKDENPNQNVSPTSNPCSDDNDENAYASVDHERIKMLQNPPSLPAPRLPIQNDMLKAPTQDVKRSRKKNRNSLKDKATEHPDPVTPNEPTDDNHPLRKKTKSFAPFFQIGGKKVNSSDQSPQPESPHKSFESSTEILAKQDRGALPPVPKDLASSDNEEGYSCIETKASKNPLPSRESKSSSSSAEGPYSELTFDPKKKRAEKAAAELLTAIDYNQIEDGNTSPMEIDEAYSCIDDLKTQAKDKSPISPTDPQSDLELPPRALPQPPNDAKKAPHQYVDSKEIKRRKKEQRYKKEEERRLSGAIEVLLPDPPFETQKTTEKIEEEIGGKKLAEAESQQFMSLKSIFSDFHKDEDTVSQALPHVLGLPPPEPPHDSDDETQSYASVAKVREQKHARKTPIAPEPPVKSDDILTTEQPQTLENTALSMNEDIGDHTYSTLVECQPYEEPNVVLGTKEQPMYEDIHTEKMLLKDTHTEAKTPLYESIGKEVKTPTYEVPVDLIDREIHDDDNEPKSKIDSRPKNEDEYATPRFENAEPEVDEKVSQNLSKLREQKGYVKVSHQKDNMPEYASIDDVKKVSNKIHETKEDVSQNDEIQNDVFQNDVFQNDVIQNDETQNDIIQNDEIHNDATQNDDIHIDVTQNDETQNDMIQDDEMHDDVAVIPSEKLNDDTANAQDSNTDVIKNEATIREDSENSLQSPEIAQDSS